MNKHVHRLVFDRRRAMQVPAAEHVRGARKAGGTEGPDRTGASTAPAVSFKPLTAPAMSLSALLVALAWTPVDTAWAQSRGGVAGTRSIGAGMMRSGALPTGRVVNRLPVLATDPTRTATNTTGGFTVGENGTTMTVVQNGQKVIINWDSFDVGQGYTVRFVQPANGAALNNIWDNNPSVILGRIQANGEVILQNQNGIIFGPTARVDTGRFVATALSLAKETFDNGLRANLKGEVIFGGDSQSDKGFITVERGAEIKALAGGDVIMVAPKVYNEGRIETPSGQTVLAAGQKVYLYSPSDAAQRGMIVAVDPFAVTDTSPDGINTVEQAQAGSYKTVNGETVSDATPDGTAGLEKKINQVIADKGRINLVGLTVRQNGVLSATTAVKGQNGAIYLQGQKSTYEASAAGGAYYRKAAELGTVELGAGSITSVTPSASADTQYSAETFYRSKVDIQGRDIRIREGSLVQAVSGNLMIRAAENAQTSALFEEGTLSGRDDSTLIVETGVTLSAAGLRDVLLPMSRNQLVTQLFQIDLAGAPVQREGVAYRQEVYADARRQVSLADVTGYYKLIGRTAREMSVRGGNVVLASMGSTVLADGSRVDISGGNVRYASGKLVSSMLRNPQGLVSLEDADAGTRYEELITPVAGNADPLLTVAGYAEGADAGYTSVMGSHVYVGADIRAEALVGPLQRAGQLDASTAAIDLGDALKWSQTLVDSPWLYASLRPRAGTVSIGMLATEKFKDADPGIGRIELVAGKGAAITAVPEVGSDEAAAFLAGLGTVRLSTAALQSGGVGSLVLKADEVSMAAGTSLNLGASGRLDVRATRTIQMDGRVRAEGGEVSLEAVKDANAAVVLGDAAVIDVSGRKADERGRVVTDAVSADGGTVTLGSSGSVDLGAARIDVSGGYWLSGSSRTKGKAGEIALSVNQGQQNATTEPRMGRLLMDRATLSGYDFATGGTLSIAGVRTLSVGAVPVAQASQWQHGLNLSADFFSQGGFGTFNLSALGDVAVMDGTQVRARMQNLYAPTAKRQLVAGDAGAATQVVTLDDSARHGVNIALTASLSPDKSAGSASNNLAEGGSVMIGAGAVLDADAGGRIALSAGRDITVAGTLRAQGGRVDMKLSGKRDGESPDAASSSNDVGYIEDQEIRLQRGSLIDVSGVVNSVTQNRRTTGTVLAGGSVNLNYSAGTPSRGRVVTEEGSSIDISGASGLLHLGSGGAANVVKQGAGSVSVGSADGFSLQGTFKADRPDATVQGGAFLASLSLERGNDVVKSGTAAEAYPTIEGRNILLLGSTADVAQRGLHYGEGVLSTQALMAAGFDRLTLRSDQRITFGTGAQLVAREGKAPLRSVVLTSRQLASQDNTAHAVKASYVSVGSHDLVPMARGAEAAAATAAASGGKASLAIDAGLIEVRGYLGLKGWGDTQLSAMLSADHSGDTRTNGEIRFIGSTFGSSSADIAGQLSFDGHLTLKAGVLYASTLSDMKVEGGDKSVLTVLAPDKGSSSTTPLSALGKLTLRADDIGIDGVIHQPFGQIDIKAENTLTVGSHAALSVSGEGVVVPVGTTVNGSQWVYSTVGTASGAAADAPTTVQLDKLMLDANIQLEGTAELKVDPKAVLAAQAGGDLQAWEFVSGVGGLTDVLDKPGYYAIVPGYNYDFAPHDTEVAATAATTSGLPTPGSQVTITTDNGVLRPGTYTLLPARYALMQGAVLVSTTQLAQGNTLSKAAVNDDGSVVVSGYQTSTGTQIGSSTAGAALVLVPQSTLLKRSQLDRTSVNGYLATQAVASGKTVTRRPGDAGRVSLGSDNAFDINATFKLAGGELDLWMGDRMAVVDGGAAPAGYAAVDVSALEDAGARSVLLGGKRSAQDDGTAVEARSGEVLWATSVSTGTELMTVATQHVGIADGVTLRNTQADSSTAQTLIVKDGAAAMLLTNRVDTELARTDGPADKHSASLSLGKGVRLEGSAVQIDAVGDVSLGTDTQWSANAIGLGAKTIVIGAEGEGGALSLQGETLNALASVQRLRLRASQSIDIAGSQAIGQRDKDTGVPTLASLVLDARQIRGLGTADDEVVLTARNVTLRNSGGGAAGTGTGASRLRIVSEPGLNDLRTGGITVARGAQHLAFQQAELVTTGDVVLEGQGSLHAQGDLTVQAARLTAAQAAQQTLDSAGVLTIARADKARTLGEQRGAGAKVTLSGERVVQSGVVDLASGRLQLTGRGQGDAVDFQEKSVTDVSGRVSQAGQPWAISSAGGEITATAQSGKVLVNGTLDVSAAAVASTSDTAKSAGTITFSATGAQGAVHLGKEAVLKGTAATDSLSGKLIVDTRALASSPAGAGNATVARGTLDRLAELANQGQMHGSVNLRLREGSQTLNTTLKAVRTTISVDQGSLTLQGLAKIDAAAPQGGVVSLSARDDVVLESNAGASGSEPKGATIDARATATGANGGDVLLSSATGHVKQAQGASVTAVGDANDPLDGRIVLRAGINEEATDLTDPDYKNRVRITLADASLLSAGEVTVEPVKVYTAGDASQVVVYSREVISKGTVTKVEVVAASNQTRTITSVGAGKLTTVEFFTQGADGQITVVGQKVLGGEFDPGITPSSTSRNTGATVPLGTTYSGTKLTVLTRTDKGATLAPTALTTIDGDAASFMAGADRIHAALGLDKVSRGRGGLRFGVELRAPVEANRPGDFTLWDNLNLANLRPNGQPINLTVRAENNIRLLANLSDGFSAAGRAADAAKAPTMLNAGEAASYRLVAGADLNAANMMATKADGQSDLTVGAGAIVRTTSGSIELAASGDVVLQPGTGNQPVQGVVYVAGRPVGTDPIVKTWMDDEGRLVVQTVSEAVSSATNAWAQFTEHGGRLDVMAGGDIEAPGFTQLFSNWLYHTGPAAGSEAWWTAFDSFKQGFGSFGGGNVSLVAAGNIVNAGVAAPTSARHIQTITTTETTQLDGSVTTASTDSTRWQVDNGGNITVRAGGDVRGGALLLGRGQGLVDAGGGITQGTAYDASKLKAQSIILGLMDGQWSLQTRGDLSLGLVYNPTILLAPATRVSPSIGGMYYTYGADSAVHGSSVAGQLAWDETQANGLVTNSSTSNWHNVYATDAEKIGFTNITTWQSIALVAPPTVRLQSAGGDLSVRTSKDVALFPSTRGDLALYASGDMKLLASGGSDAGLALSNTDPTTWYTVGNPLGRIAGSTPLPLEIAGGARLVQTGSLLHAHDDTPARLYAGGVLDFSTAFTDAQDSSRNTANFLLSLSKPAQVIVGGDLANPLISVQHFDDQDVSLIRAGGNIEGGYKADNKGTYAIKVAGPGELRVEAGHHLNLNASNGVLSIGDVNNDRLPRQGASLRLEAGARPSVQVDAFAAAYLQGQPAEQTALVGYVRGVLKLDADALAGEGAYAQALALYAGFSREHQITFAQSVVQRAFVASFVAEGRPYAQGWARAAAEAGVTIDRYDSAAFKRYKDEVLMAEVARLGSLAVDIPDSTDANINAANKARRDAVWAQLADVAALAGMGKGLVSSGSIDVAASTVQTTGHGDQTHGGIDLFAFGGDVVVGLSRNDSRGQGIITYDGGSIRSVLGGDFQVNSQKTFVVGRGDMTIYSSLGAIDSGRGSNTTVTAPPGVGRLVDGYMTFQQGAVTSGSGLAILDLPDGTSEGDISLFAPVGGIKALDTFIRNRKGSVKVGGPLTGGDNIKSNNVQGAPLAVSAGPAMSTPSTLPGDTAAGVQELASQSERGRGGARNGILTVDLLEMGDGAAAPAAGGQAECINGTAPGCVRRP